ncbi:PLD nuclease N-terminal domain-containing protein [Defluviimonas aestuarii]|uniref:PLD nuclease N-terminal domain-containing protein n=1 Tax=Albidovulum aestuarii TaxID=1130726 RepID=UPI00249AAA9E|nr:PLD nuclease N-terminal domain-containing protein [Defluviimonas aestuarii]MDI3335555.1 PLD nuclease N-terminal domain-containing protein [Defluviimonas aestuarii]
MEMNMLSLSGFGGLLILALDIWALVSIFGSTAPNGRKVLWVLLVFFLPIIGFVIWLIAGPRSSTRHV